VGRRRAPVNVDAVVDVSGSMGELARVKDRTGVEVNDGLSLLDVVKHAHGLGPNQERRWRTLRSTSSRSTRRLPRGARRRRTPSAPS
jgi:hypothetical protein